MDLRKFPTEILEMILKLVLVEDHLIEMSKYPSY
jgi:hypothetical protein